MSTLTLQSIYFINIRYSIFFSYFIKYSLFYTLTLLESCAWIAFKCLNLISLLWIMPHDGFIEFQDLAHTLHRHNRVWVVFIVMESGTVTHDMASKGDTNDTRLCLRTIASCDKSIDIPKLHRLDWRAALHHPGNSRRLTKADNEWSWMQC